MQLEKNSSFSIKKYQNNKADRIFSKNNKDQINKNYQEIIEREKKNKIIFRRELHKVYKKAFIPPPKISAKAYVIYEVIEKNNNGNGSKILATINGKNSQQVASLTKIMTCVIILEISENFKLNLEQETTEIGKF